MLIFLFLLVLVKSINIVTWIAYINDEYITSYFNSDDPTHQRYCGKDFSIIKDSNDMYYMLRINEKGMYEAFPIDINNDIYKKYKSMLNSIDECFIDRKIILTTYNYGIVHQCI